MTLSHALSNAVSGLTANGYSASLISSNIANATTEGYGPRELSLTARTGSGGVRVEGLERRVNTQITADRRAAESDHSLTSTVEIYLSRVGQILPTPDQPGSLTGLLGAFEASLIEASAKPQSEIRLQNTLRSAQNLSSAIARSSQGIQALRTEVEHEIAAEVDQLNRLLAQLQSLNTSIAKATPNSQNEASLRDQRANVLDSVARLVPIKSSETRLGAIQLRTVGGLELLNDKPADVAFEKRSLVTAEMTADTASLGQIEVNGSAYSAIEGKLSGGKLEALFELRDVLLPTATAQMDGLATELIHRFQTTVDPTLPAGQQGWFTASDTAQGGPAGISTGLEVNELLSSDATRLRDGLVPPAGASVGDPTILLAALDRLGAVAEPQSPQLGQTSLALSGVVGKVLSHVSQMTQNSQEDHSFAAAKFTALVESERAMGVDTDHELQKLLIIERNYAANSRVIETVETMLDSLMRALR